MTSLPPKLPSLFEQFMSAAASAAAAKSEARRPPWPTNPFPTGIRAGSTTDRVLSELRRAFPQSLEHGQLRHRCQAARGAICWATSFLIHLGKIHAITDPRSPKYQRYRLAPGEADDAMSCTTVCSPFSAPCRLATLLPPQYNDEDRDDDRYDGIEGGNADHLYLACQSIATPATTIAITTSSHQEIQTPDQRSSPASDLSPVYRQRRAVVARCHTPLASRHHLPPSQCVPATE
jgi:hypothetical protein